MIAGVSMKFLRPESSLSSFINEFGEEVFAGDRPGPVIHRTPEELGIPRTVRHVEPLPQALWPAWNTGPVISGAAQARNRAYGLERYHREKPHGSSVKKDAPVKAAGAKINATEPKGRQSMVKIEAVSGGA